MPSKMPVALQNNEISTAAIVKELKRSEDHSDDASATKPKPQWVQPSSGYDRLVRGGKR